MDGSVPDGEPEDDGFRVFAEHAKVGRLLSAEDGVFGLSAPQADQVGVPAYAWHLVVAVASRLACAPVEASRDGILGEDHDQSQRTSCEVRSLMSGS